MLPLIRYSCSAAYEWLHLWVIAKDAYIKEIGSVASAIKCIRAKMVVMNATSQQGTVRPSTGAQHPGQEGTVISGLKGNRPPPSWLPTFTKPCIVTAHKACLS